MCIIVYKRSGVELPTKDVLRNCWDNNPDGAGFMAYKGNEVAYSKGFMKFKHLWKAFSKCGFTKDDSLAIHFRIATAGGVSQGNCHPFPVSADKEDLTRLHGVTANVAMHNGIIGEGTEDLSDTQLFIRDVLSNLIPYVDDARVINAIENLTSSSKFVIFTPTGSKFTGNWIEQKTTGLYFSNSTYKERYYSVITHWSEWDDDYSGNDWWKAYSRERDAKAADEVVLSKEIEKDFDLMCPECGQYLFIEELTDDTCCPFCHADCLSEFFSTSEEGESDAA